jgi:hypothetical protein
MRRIDEIDDGKIVDVLDEQKRDQIEICPIPTTPPITQCFVASC